MLKVLRFALLGAGAAVILSGTFGLDAYMPDAWAAAIGGTAVGFAAQTGLLA